MSSAGQQITFTNAIKTAIRSILSDELHTCLPGKITKILDYKKKKVSVKPLLKRTYLDGTILELPIIDNVPVVYPDIGEALLKFPLIVGAKVLLLFSERSLDNWLLSGNDSIPGNPNKFSLSDAIAILGLSDFSRVNDKITDNTSLELIYKDSRITLKDNGDIVATSGNTLTLKKDGDIEVGGQALKKLINESFKDVFNNHVHNFIAAPSGSFSTSTPASTIPTALPPPSVPGGALATFGSAITSSEMTQKVKGE